MNIGQLWAQIGLDNTLLKSGALESEQVLSRMDKSAQSFSDSTALSFSAVGIAAAATATVIATSVYKAIQVIDDFQVSVLQIAAQITQMQGPKDVEKNFQLSKQYADALAEKLQEIDANSFASSKGLMAMTQAMTTGGIILDINNKKQVESFTALSNAIAMYTKGQDQAQQSLQEMRALMSGVVDRSSRVSQILDAQIKQQGIYKYGLKEVVELGKRHGDLLERLAPYLTGINAASADIAKTWSAVSSSMETAVNKVVRAGFKTAYEDVVPLAAQLVDYLKDHADLIGGVIQRGWEITRTLVTTTYDIIHLGVPILQTTATLFGDIFNLVSKIALVITAIPDFLANAPGVITALGVAAYYAVGGIAGMTAAYEGLVGVIAASMATNPLGWIVLGLTALYVAARPAISAIDDLMQRYSGLTEQVENAKQADQNWEFQKQRALFAYREGGVPLSSAMRNALGSKAIDAPKVPPAPEDKTEYKDSRQEELSARRAYQDYLKASYEREAAIVKNANDIKLQIEKSGYEFGLVDLVTYTKERNRLIETSLNAELGTKLKELAAAREAEKKALTEYRKDATGSAAATVNKAYQNVERSIAAVEAAQTKLKIAQIQGFDESHRAILDQQKTYDDLGIQILELTGRYEEAANARRKFDSTTTPAQQAQQNTLDDFAEFQARQKKKQESTAWVQGNADIRSSIPDAMGNTDRSAQLTAQYEKDIAVVQIEIDRMEQLYLQDSENYEQALERKRLISQRFNSEQLANQQRWDADITQQQLGAASKATSILASAAQNSKGIQLAALAVQTGIAIAQIQISAKVAEMRALAELGPIAGAPIAATIEALAWVNTGLVIAAAAVQASQISGARANGGSVVAGQTYIVNENRRTEGPELFTPGVSGVITPASKVGGGKSLELTQVFQVSTGVSETVQAEIRRAAPALMQSAVQAVKQAMSNGEFQGMGAM